MTPEEISTAMLLSRKRLGLGVRGMAKRVGVSPATLSRVENCKEMSVETAKALLPFAGSCVCCGRDFPTKIGG